MFIYCSLLIIAFQIAQIISFIYTILYFLGDLALKLKLLCVREISFG